MERGRVSDTELCFLTKTLFFFSEDQFQGNKFSSVANSIGCRQFQLVVGRSNYLVPSFRQGGWWVVANEDQHSDEVCFFGCNLVISVSCLGGEWLIVTVDVYRHRPSLHRLHLSLAVYFMSYCRVLIKFSLYFAQKGQSTTRTCYNRSERHFQETFSRHCKCTLYLSYQSYITYCRLDSSNTDWATPVQ